MYNKKPALLTNLNSTTRWRKVLSIKCGCKFTVRRWHSHIREGKPTADDSLEKGLVVLWEMVWSDLKINYLKFTDLFVDISVNYILISLVFNYRFQKLPITYLGLPFTIGKLNKTQWRPLIHRIQKRLAGWKGKMLSLEGRITMINTVLSAMHTYFLSFFSLPRWIEREIAFLKESFFGQ